MEHYFQEKGNKEEMTLEIGEGIGGYQHKRGPWLDWGVH